MRLIPLLLLLLLSGLAFPTPWDISTAEYNSVYISTQDSDPIDLFFKPDGTKLYEMGGNAARVYQYTCTIPWNLSSCTYDSVYISMQDSLPSGLFFKPDGAALYEMGLVNDIMYQYTCSTPWDLSSCTYDSISIPAQDGDPTGLFFKSDGAILYEVGRGSDRAYQYTCTTPWNLSSCTYDSVYLSMQDEMPFDLFFKPDGAKLYEIGIYTNDRVYQYTCTTPWDLSSCTYDSVYLSMQDSGPNGLFFKPDGTRLYEIGTGANRIYQYSMGSAPATENVTLNSSLGANLASENLTLYYDSYDPDSDAIKNITNWWVDGLPIAVLNMPFEGGSNSTYTKDYSNYSNNGTVSGATWNATGGYDGFGAYTFDGSSDYIIIANSSPLNLHDHGTIAGWIYMPGYPVTWGGIVNKGNFAGGRNGYTCYINTGDHLLKCATMDASFFKPSQSPSAIGLNQWVFFAFAWNSTAQYLYINGTQVDSDVAVSTTPEAYDLTVGSTSGGVYKFNGTIDDIMIFNRTLSAEQITALYNNRTDLIVSQETDAGEEWYACVTPNDLTQDGSEVCSNSLNVVSSCEVISSPGTYTLVNNISGANSISDVLGITQACIVIASDDVTFDCDGYSIINNGTADAGGIVVNGSTTIDYTNVIIQNCPSISQYEVGVFVYYTEHSIIQNVTAHNNTNAGIYLYRGLNSNISNTTIYSNPYGTILVRASGNNITNSLMYENVNSGIWMETDSENNSVVNNTAHSNNDGFYVYSDSNYNNFTDNTAYNNTEYGIYIYSSDNNTITNNTMYDNLQGIRLRSSLYNTLTNNTAYNNTEYGILLYLSSNYNNLINNSAYNNSNTGIYLFTSSNYNNLTNNTAHNNTNYGFYLSSSSSNTLTNNSAYGNSGYGIYLLDSVENTLSNCTLHNNQYGFYADNSNYTMITNYFLSSSGTFADYTNLSIVDIQAGGEEYSINWSASPASAPTSRGSLENKYLDITTQAGSPSIDTITWHWDESEVSGYDESKFELWNYTSIWSLLNNTPDTSSNALTLYSLTPTGVYGLFENQTVGCEAITSPGTYTMTENLSGAPNSVSGVSDISQACIVIASENVTLDCSGFSITNDDTADAAGIVINGSTTLDYANVTIQNCPNISEYKRGIYLHRTTQDTIMNSTARNNTQYGIYLYYSESNILTNNTAYNNSLRGFYLDSSSGNNLTGNIAYENSRGFSLTSSSHNNTLANNAAHNQSQYGFELSSSSGNNLTGNIAYNSTLGFAILSDAMYNVFTNNTAYNGTNYGFWFGSGTGSNTLINNTAYNNGQPGFNLYSTSGNSLTNNTAHDNNAHGFALSSSENNTLTGNTAYDNSDYGFRLASSSNNNLTNNTAHENKRGFHMEDSGGNTISNCTAYGNQYGLYAYNSNYTLETSLFLPAGGTLENYTNLSITDIQEAGEIYQINWSASPGSSPAARNSFENKYLDIIAQGGTPSIDEITWHWDESELTGYDESEFELWNYTSAWSLLNDTPETSSNALALYSFTPTGIYGLFEQGNSVPVTENVTLNSSLGTNTSSENLTLYYDVYDADGNATKNITNWWVDSIPIAVLNMPFEGGSNSTYAKDYSNYSNDGTVDGATWNATGGHDGFGAYEFDGANDYAVSENTLDLSSTDKLTISFWVKFVQSGTPLIFFEHSTNINNNNAFLIYHSDAGGDGTIQFTDKNATASNYNVVYTSNSYGDGEYHHVAIVVDRSLGIYQSTIYVDGVNDTILHPTLRKDIIGNYGNYDLYTASRAGLVSFYNGSIDDIMIFNRTLSEEQILALYNNRTDLIVSQETNAGEEWYACVTPNDGTEDGNETCSNPLVIVESSDLWVNETIGFNDSSPRQNDVVEINSTIHSDLSQNYTNVNVSLYVDLGYNDSTLVNITDGYAVARFNWTAEPGNKSILIAVDPEDSQSESNETNNNASSYLFVAKVAAIEYLSPVNSTGIIRGKTDGGTEDPRSYVPDYTVLTARVFDYFSASEGISANCTFYFNGTYLGMNETGSGGNCTYGFDHTVYDAGEFAVAVNFTDLDPVAEGLEGNFSANATLTIATYNTTNDELNTRPGLQYMLGDAAVLAFNVTRNGTLTDPNNITVEARKSSPDFLCHSHTYPGDIVRTGTGEYYSKTIVDDCFGLTDIHWYVYIDDNLTIGGVKQEQAIPAASGSHSDVQLVDATAAMNLTAIAAGGSLLENTSVTVYDRNLYELETDVLNSSDPDLYRPAAQNDTYRIEYAAENGTGITINSVNATADVLRVSPQVVEDYSGTLPGEARTLSQVMAMNDSLFNFTNATISIPIGGLSRVDYIFHCSEWNFDSGECASWEQNATSDYADYSINATHFSFSVYGFTAYAGGVGYNTNLTIYDEYEDSQVSTGTAITFYANYTNSTDGTQVSGAECNVSFDDGETASMGDNGENYNYTKSGGFSLAGTHEWNVSCYAAGYDYLNATDTILVTSTPEVTLDSPGEGYATNLTEINFSFSFTDSDYGHANCSIYLDGTYNQSNESTINDTLTNFTIPGIDEGAHNWSVSCADNSNETGSSETRNFTVDLTAPVLSISSPANTSYATNNISVNYTTNGTSCSMFLNGVFNTSLSSCENTTLSNLIEGQHYVTIYANDSVNNSASDEIYFTVDSGRFYWVSECMAITSPGTYNLTENLSGAAIAVTGISDVNVACIAVQSHNVVLNCSGHTITNNGTSDAAGVASRTYDNLTIRDCAGISGYEDGIVLDDADGGAITNNTLHNNTDGIIFTLSYDFSITNNTLHNNTQDGIRIWSSSRHLIANNTAYSNAWSGIDVNWGSQYNTIADNLAYDNDYGFQSYDDSWNNFTNNVAYNNSRGLSLACPSMDSVSGNVAYNNTVYGILLYATEESVTNNNVTNNTAYGNYNGFGIVDSAPTAATINTIFANNTAYGNSHYGLEISGALRTTVLGSTLHGNLRGISIGSSSHNTSLANNTIYNNTEYGVSLSRSLDAFFGNLTLYGNGHDFLAYASMFLPLTNYTMETCLFLNPAGTLVNYTNLSITDSLNNEDYTINWSASPASAPGTRDAFANKFLNVTVQSGSPAIDSIAWHWEDSEASGYDESFFELWKYNASGWTLLNDTPDVSSNTLAYSNFYPASIYGILQLNDSSAPQVTLGSPGEGHETNLTSIEFNFTATDEIYAHFNCSIRIDGTYNQSNSSTVNGTSTSFIVEGFSDGAHNWSITCTDNSSNSNSSETRNFTVDTSVPSVSISSPANATYATNNMSLNYTTDGSTCSLFLDGVANQSLSSCENTTLENLTEAQHYITIYANDSVNNTGSDEVYFTIDLTPPTVTITSPSNTSYATNNFTVTYATDGSSCSLFLDGVLNKSLPSCEATTLENLTEAQHYVTVYANDSVNNTGEDTVYFTVDFSVPTVTISSPANTTYATNNFTVNYTTTGVSCSLFLDGVANQSLSSCENTTLENLTEAQHHITIYANDSVNTTGSGEVYFTVDMTPPSVTINSPANTTYATNNFTVNYTTGGVSCSLFLDGVANQSLSSCENTTLENLTEAQHYITIYANDSVNNTGSDEVYFTVDLSAPSVTISSPSNTTYGTNNFTVNYTTTGVSCTLFLDGVANQSLSSCENTTMENLTEAQHYMTIYANDSVNNSGSDEVYFTVDTSAPAVTITSPANTTYATNNFTVNYTTTGVSCTLFLDGIANQSLSSCENTTLENLTEAQHYITIYANDSVNNTGSEEVHFTADLTAPAVTISSPSNTTYATNNLTVSYTTSGVSCSLSLDGVSNQSLPSCENTTLTGLSDGQHYITIYANDSVNNTGSDEVYFTVDISAPTLTISSPANTTYATNNFTVNYTTTGVSCSLFLDGTINQSLSSCENTTISNLTEAQHYITIYANDSVNNTGEDTVYFTIDLTAPTVTITSPSNTTYGTNNFTINYTTSGVSCSLFLDGVANQSLSSCGNTTLENLTEAQHYVTIYANDSVNNSASDEIYFTVDISAPTVTINSPANTTYATNNLTVNYTTDGLSCSLSLDGVANQSLSSCENTTLPNLSDGQHYVTIYANDSVNNTGSDEIYFTVDLSAPPVNISLPSNRTYGTSNLTVSYTTSGVSCSLFLDGVFNQSLSSCENTTVAGLSDGQHYITIYANDSVNNTGSSTVYFTVDTAYPALSVSSPSNTTYTTSGVALNYTTSDSIGLDSCWFALDGGSANTSISGCSNATLAGLSDGAHNVTVYVNDTAGNTNSSTAYFSVYTGVPTLSIASPSNSTYNSSTVSLNYTVGNDPDTCWLYLDGAFNTTFSSCGNSTLSSLSDGQHYIILYVNDSLNTTTSGTVYFTVDTAYPALNLTSPANITYNSSTIPIEYAAWDALGLSTCYYRLDGASSRTIAGCQNTTFPAPSPGQHNFTLYVEDNAGNANSSTVYFTSTYRPPDTGGGGEPEFECITNSDCGECEVCRGHECTLPPNDEDACASASDCSGEFPFYSCTGCTCHGYECMNNSYCAASEECEAGVCVPLNLTCATSQDCPAGYSCINYTCIPPECFDDGDCGVGEVCRDYECIFPGCLADEDCWEGEICRDYACIVPECFMDGDCPGGYACGNHTCIPPECVDDGDCGEGEICREYACVPPECLSDEDCGEGEACREYECVEAGEGGVEGGEGGVEGTEGGEGGEAHPGEGGEGQEGEEGGAALNQTSGEPPLGMGGDDYFFGKLLSDPLGALSPGICIPLALAGILYPIYWFFHGSKKGRGSKRGRQGGGRPGSGVQGRGAPPGPGIPKR